MEETITISKKEYDELKRLAEIGAKTVRSGQKTWEGVSQEERKRILSERGKVGAARRWAKVRAAKKLEEENKK